MERHRLRTAIAAAFALVASLVVGLSTGSAPSAAHDGDDHQAITLPAGFTDVEAIGDVTEPTAVAFAPDGTAFIGLKTGVIKSFDYDPVADQFEPNAQSTDVVTDPLASNVDNYWDRGLTGLTVDPQFGTTGHNFLYVDYTYNRDPRDNPPVVPKWYAPGHQAEQYDECTAPATTVPPSAGCVVMVRVTRLTVRHTGLGWEMVPGSERELAASGCMQFPSHASGDVVFGPDGKLYASMGDGASFDTEDYGQYLNPCGDPANEGGSLRAQDYQTAGDPLGMNGSIFRLDPALDSSQQQPQLVAYGHRNPWRMVFRPGTDELWNGDVGASSWEEINRLPNASTVTTPVNRGWPCYEGAPGGSIRNNAWDLLDKPICENLYAQGVGAVAAPYFSYRTRLNAGPLTPGEDCEYSTSSVSGVAFTPASATDSRYPAAYRGSLFFSDYARQCIWKLGKLPNGDPDPSLIQVVGQRTGTPVGLEVGPGGDVFYVDYGIVDGQITENAGGIHRIVYAPGAPTARVSVTGRVGGPEPPVDLTFSAAGSTDPNGDILRYAWDFEGDGTYTTASTNPTATHRYSRRGAYQVGLRVSDGTDRVSTTLDVQVGDPPALGSLEPSSALTWSVGQRIDYSVTATDHLGAAIPDADVVWRVSIQHCPSNVCHTHPLQTTIGPTGSFPAPDHEYPSALLVTVEATDADGVSRTRSIRLEPATSTVGFATSPAGLPVTVAGVPGVTSQTFIRGSTFTISAPSTQQQGLFSWTFGGWSDGGAATHQVVAPSGSTTYVATYLPVTSSLVVKTKRKKLELKVNGVTHKDGWAATLPVGTVVDILAPKKQKRRGVTYKFKKWKDGGSRSRVVTIGVVPLELKAVYKIKRHRARR